MRRTALRALMHRGSPEAGQLVAHLLLPLTVQVLFFVQPSDGAWDPLRSPLYLFCTALRRGLGPLKLSRSFVREGVFNAFFS